MTATERKIKALVKTWQRRLNLKDWQIELMIEDVSEEGHELLGYAQVDLHRRRARVTINPETESEDLEDVVVHELLHVRLAGIIQPFGRNEHVDTLVEHFLDDIVPLMVRED